MFVSKKDQIIAVQGVGSAMFKAGVPRPLRDGLVTAALDAGITAVDNGAPEVASKPKSRATRKTADDE